MIFANGSRFLKNHSYYKEDRLSKRGTWNRMLIDIFEYDFPYRLNTIGVTDDDKNSEDTFNEWLELQLNKTPERLIFEKLLVSVDILYEAKASLSHSLHLLHRNTNISEDTFCEKTTHLVYGRALIIEAAMTYIIMFMQQLNYADIKILMDTTNFECDPILYANSLEIIERVLPKIKLFK